MVKMGKPPILIGQFYSLKVFALYTSPFVGGHKVRKEKQSMTGKNSPISSGERTKAEFPLLKVLANLILVLAVLLVSAKGFLLYQDYNLTISQLQNKVTQSDQESADVRGQYQNLLNAYDNLQQENNRLKDSYTSLKENLDSSEVESTQLSSYYNRLKTDYLGLNSKFSSYQSSSIAAPYIAISGRNIHVAILKLDKSLVQWTIPFGSLESEMKLAEQTRTGLFGLGMPTVILKEKSGKELLVADFRKFMDTTTFKGVMKNLYEQSPDDYTFIKEVWNIVGQMIQYQREKDEIPRFPLETLVGGAGDCEDMAILYASLIKSAPVKWDVRFVYLNSKSPLDTNGTSDHVIIYIDTGKEKHYIETTSNSNMEPYTKGVAGWYLPVE